MTVEELRSHYARVLATLRKEREWRLRVFPPGHASHRAKLGEIDDALTSLAALGEAIKLEINKPEYEQPLLVDLPPARQAYR